MRVQLTGVQTLFSIDSLFPYIVRFVGRNRQQQKPKKAVQNQLQPTTHPTKKVCLEILNTTNTKVIVCLIRLLAGFIREIYRFIPMHEKSFSSKGFLPLPLVFKMLFYACQPV
ncbi:MAG TPA: hypothetical protein VMR70_14390 [Flavisolibacter sp.]|nr:hypothetical protein [Flavisolibacter sp.]